MKTLVVIPAFNERSSIRQLTDEVKALGYDYLVINDCSTDDTKEVLDSNGITHLDLPINLGLAGVTRVGFKYAHDHDYDCAICIDGDGQHLPAYIKPVVSEIENGADYVIGSRFVKYKKPVNSRMIGSRLLTFLIKLKTGKRVYDPTSGMRAMGKKVIANFDRSMNFYAEPDAVTYLIRNGYDVREIQVEMKERETGVSYFHNPFKSLYFMLAEVLSIIFVQ